MQISEFIEHLNFSRSLKATINQNTDIFSVQLLPEKGQKLKNDLIYLTTDLTRIEELVKTPEIKNLFCLCPANYLKKVNSLKISPETNIIFADPSDMTDLFLMRSKLTEQIFSDLNEQIKLLEDLIVAGSMEQLVEKGTEYLGHPFMAMDNMQNILCSGIGEEETETAVRNIIAEAQPFSEQPGVERFNVIDRATYILPVQKSEPVKTLLISQFTADRKVFGYLVVDHGVGQVTMRDYYKISVLSSLVCKLVLSWDRVRVPINSFETLFLRILEGNMSQKNAQEECRKLAWKKPERMRLIVAERDDGQDSPTILQPAFDALQNLITGAKGLLYTNKIVLFVPADKTDEDYSSALYEWNLRCGVSQSFEDISEARTFYRQADSALRLSRELSFENCCNHFEDMSIYFMLNDIHDPFRLKQMVSPGIFRLMQADQESNSELLNTFENYVDCVGNINVVSEKMFVHRNTVKYRIGKIEEILQTDLKDPASYHNYMLSFKIIDYLKRRKLW